MDFVDCRSNSLQPIFHYEVDDVCHTLDVEEFPIEVRGILALILENRVDSSQSYIV